MLVAIGVAASETHLDTGIALGVVAAKHVVAHPDHGLGTSDLVALAASVATFLGGFLSLQWQNARRVVPERVASIVIVAGLCAAAGRISRAA